MGRNGNRASLEGAQPRASVSSLAGKLLLLVPALLVFLSLSVSAAVTVQGDYFPPSGTHYVFWYDADNSAATPCNTGDGMAGNLLGQTFFNSPDGDMDDDAGWNITNTNTIDGNTYLYLCLGSGGSGALLASKTVTVVNGNTYYRDLGWANEGGGVSNDLDGKNVVICDELGGTKLSTQAKVVVGTTFSQYYIKDGITGDDVYVLIQDAANGDACTFDSNTLAATKFATDSGTYGVHMSFAADTKFSGDAHAELTADNLITFTSDTGYIIGLAETVAAPDGEDDLNDDITTYLDSARITSTYNITLAKSGKITQIVASVPKATMVYDFVVHVEGTVSDEIDYIDYSDGDAATTYTHHVVPVSNAYELYVPADAAANTELITMKDGGVSGTTVFTADSTAPTITGDVSCTPGAGGAATTFTITAVAAAGDNDWDGTAANGECTTINVVRLYGTLDDTFQVAGTEQMNVIDDYSAPPFETYNPIDLSFNPTGGSPEYNTYFVLYYADDAAVTTGTLDTAYDIYGVSAGAVDYEFYLNEQLTGLDAVTYDKEMNMEYKLNGTTPEGAGETVIITDGSAGTAEAAATTVATGYYELYAPSMATAADPYYQYFFVSNVLEMDAGATPFAADDLFDVAKVTGSEVNVHADLLNNGGGATNDEIHAIVASAGGGGSALYSIAAIIDAGDNGAGAEVYTSYFMVPNNTIRDTDGLVNFAVYDGDGTGEFEFLYNLSSVPAASYTFEPKAKLTATLTATTDNIEVVSDAATDLYTKYRSNIDVAIKLVYLDTNAGDPDGTASAATTKTTDATGAYNVYTDDAFTTKVLSRGTIGSGTGAGKNLAVAAQTFKVATLGGEAHADLEAQDSDNVMVYSNTGCTTAISSENISIAPLGGNDYTQYYETDETNPLYLGVNENDGTNNYWTCDNPEQNQDSAGGTAVSYDLDEKVSGNVAPGITIMYFDNDGAGTILPANFEVASTVVISTDPDSYKAYWAGAADTDVMAWSTVAELLREGIVDYVAPGSDTFNVGRVGFTTHTDMEAGANDNLAVYSDTACTTEVSSSSDGSATEKVGAATTVYVYFQGSDGTDYYGEGEYEDAVSKYEICRTIAWRTTSQDATANLSFDYKISGTAPDDAGGLITNDIIAVGVDLTGGNTNDYWVDSEDIGATNDYYLYISDADSDNQVNYWSTAGGAGTRLLSRTNVTTGTDVDMDVSVFYGDAHASIKAAGNYVQVCDTAITASSQAGTCPGKRSSNDSTSGIVPAENGYGGAADYAIYFVDEGAGDTAYFIEVNDTDTLNYYSYVTAACTGPGVECNIELDGKLSADIVEDYNTAIGINGVRCLIGDNTIANEISFTYSIGGGLATVAKCIAYANSGDATYDYRFTKQTYITQDYLTNGDAGADPDMNGEALDLTLTGAAGNTMEVELATGIQVHVTTQETGDPTNIGTATVTILNCSNLATCNADTSLGSICTVAGVDNQPCSITGDNSAGKGQGGMYYFAGIPDAEKVKIKVSKTNYTTYEYPSDSDNPDVNYYTTSSTTPITVTIELVQGTPECTVTAVGGAGTYESAGMLYADVGDSITFTYQCGDTNLSVVGDMSALGGSATTAFAETSGVYTHTQTVGAVADGAKTITVTSTNGVNVDTDTIQVTVDGTAPATAIVVSESPAAAVDEDGVVTWVWTAATDASSGLKNYNVQISTVTDCSSAVLYEATTTEISYTRAGLTDANTFYACIVAVDNVGNTGTQANSDGILIDSSVPAEVQLLTPLDGARVSDTTPTVTWQDVAGEDTYTIEVDDSSNFGSIVDTCSLAANTVSTVVGDGTCGATPLTDGTLYYWRVRAVDADAADGEWSDVYQFTVDVSAPTVSASGPSTLQNTRSVTITATTNENAECRFVATTDVAYASMTDVMAGASTEHSAMVLATDRASNTYYVRCIDAAGNPMAAGTEITFLVNATAPSIIDAMPAYRVAPYRVATLGDINITTDIAANCMWDVNEASYANMANGPFATVAGTSTTVTGAAAAVGEGLNLFYVRCNTTDGSAQEMSSSGLISFNYDSIAPNYTILSVRNDGNYHAYVNESDVVVIKIEASELLAVDPTITLGGVSPDSTSVTGDVYTCEWTIDGDFADGSTPDLSVDGGSDAAGNPDTALAQADVVTVDKTAPFMSNPLPTTTQNSRSFQVSVDSDADALYCAFDTNDVNYSQMQYYATDLGNYTFVGTLVVPTDETSYVVYFACTDAAGNVNMTRTSSFLVDATAPTITASSPQGGYKNATQTISVTTDVNANCKYDVQDRSYATMAYGFATGNGSTAHTTTVTPAAQGDIHYYVACADLNGNPMNRSIVTYFTYDTIAPTLTRSNEWTSSSTYHTFMFSDEALGGIVMTFDGNAMAQESGNGTLFLFSYDMSALADGDYEVDIGYCADLAGNNCLDPLDYYPYNVTLDTEAPGVTAISYNFTTWLLAVTTNESAVCKYSYSDDAYDDMPYGMSDSNLTSHYALIVPRESSTPVYVYVRCSDYDNNVMATSNRTSIAQDTVAPTIVSRAPVLFAYSRNVTLWVYTNENSTCEYATTPFDYGEGTAMTSADGMNHTAALTDLEDGPHNYYAKCADLAGNVMPTSEFVGFYVDTAGNFNVTQQFNVGWNWFPLPRVVLANLTSLGGDYSVVNVFETNGGIANTSYNFLYGRNVTSGLWASYVPGRVVNDLTQFHSDYDAVPYWVHMTVADRLELS